MLGVKAYPRTYIEDCRARVESDVAAYRDFGAVVSKQGASTTGDAFEPVFFNNLLLNLDYSFVHRLRTVEGKDGNPMNEVRVLCGSLLEHGGVFTADKSIKLTPEKSVLKLEYGQRIRLSESQFQQICKAFFEEIGRKFSD
jgi:hypothetical protein